jgi:hypothetical protein
MPELRGAFDAELAARVAGVETLAQAAARFRIDDVVVQDEFSHDVIAGLEDGRRLVFEAG